MWLQKLWEVKMAQTPAREGSETRARCKRIVNKWFNRWADDPKLNTLEVRDGILADISKMDERQNARKGGSGRR